MKKQIIIIIQKLQILSALSMHLTQITGKSKYPIHPKHLVKKTIWYKKYLNKKDVVLDMGCDTGQHSIDISKKVKKVIAFDSNELAINVAEKRANENKLKNIKFEIQNSEKQFYYKANYFTAILCLDVLEHLKNETLALKEIKRILKPKGKLFLSIPNINTSWKKAQKSAGLFYFSDTDHKREYTLEQIKKLCKDFKFEIKFIKPITLDTPLAPLIDLTGGFSLSIYKKLSDWKKTMVREKPEESVGFQVYAINKK